LQGTYTVDLQVGMSSDGSAVDPVDPVTWEVDVQFITGTTQFDPFLPNGQTIPGVWVFDNMPAGFWYDPILADGFEFEMLGGSLFTEAGMPVGLGDPNGYIVNYFDGLTEVFVPVAEGENYIFPGAGVSSFKVLDIGPPFDP